VAVSATAESMVRFALVVSEPVAVSATAELMVRVASVVSEPVAVSATSFWYVLAPDPLIAENGAVENGSKPNTLLPYMSCAVVRFETCDVVRTSGIVMGISSKGTFSCRFTHPCPMYQRHVPGSVGFGVRICHAPDAHMTSWFSGTSVGGEGAGCQPSVPSVSVLGIDPFFVQYCMV
jgi:hypothetical protein